ncbi:MAG: hypothetical protein ACRELX_07510 [Longimicrobiales bacterium]
MNVRDIRPEPVGPGHATPVNPVRGVPDRQDAPQAPEARDREDLVEISDEARALAAQGEPAAATSLGAERLLALRRWVQSGGYDAPEVTDRVARRLIELGDV